MNLTIKNYKSVLSPELIKQSQKCAVRECDEISPGHFESYIDVLNKSFDVNITLEKSAVIFHKCDCEDPSPFCQHKTALFLFIVKGDKKQPAKITKAKKIDPLQEAIELADPRLLTEWVLKIAKKHKDIGISFMNEFANKSSDYTPQEIIDQTQNCLKAVINKKTKADALEVKKIIELWSDLHRSILENYRAQPTNEAYFLQFNAIIDVCSFYEDRLSTTSKRISSYIKQIIEEVSAVVTNIRENDSWKKSLTYFTKALFLNDYGFRRPYLELIATLFTSSDKERKSIIVELMVLIYEEKVSASQHDRDHFLQHVFRLVILNDQFKTYKHLFPPIRHALSYNLKLIDTLIEEEDFKSAEAYCLLQIKENTNNDYDFEYYERLIEIYKMSGDEMKLSAVLKRQLLKNPDFLDYQFVSLHRSSDNDFNHWKNRVLANARQMAHYDSHAAEFSLALVESEGNYQRMIDYIDEKIDYEVILQYAPGLILNAPQSFLNKLINRIDYQGDRDWNEYEPETLDECLENLYSLLAKNYSVEALVLSVKKGKNTFRIWSNLLVKYLDKKLPAL
ncbi:hypothetical protein ACVWYN_003646 [Pedobacter sp. UYP24]